MDEQNDLFEPFNRLHAENSSIEGTGIGLALSKKLMQMMDGTIGCISQPGEGATFWVEFARRDKDGQNPELTDKQLDPKALKTYQGMILYVEDNPDNLTLMEEIIAEETAYQLLTAPTAEIGLSLARQHHPDVIILDINLPGMDGIETMKIIKADAALKQIPVFALSANVTDNTVQHALAAGFQAYLNKPLDVDVLLKALEVAVV